MQEMLSFFIAQKKLIKKLSRNAKYKNSCSNK